MDTTDEFLRLPLLSRYFFYLLFAVWNVGFI